MERIPKDRCQQIKDDGTRCRTGVMTGSTFCFFHDPRQATKRTEARKAGGRKKAAAVLPAATPDRPLQAIPDVVSLLGETINQVRRGELDPRVANAVGYLAGIFLKAVEQGRTDERLAALEAVVAGQQPTDLSPTPDPDVPIFQFEQAAAG